MGRVNCMTVLVVVIVPHPDIPPFLKFTPKVGSVCAILAARNKDAVCTVIQNPPLFPIGPCLVLLALTLVTSFPAAASSRIELAFKTQGKSKPVYLDLAEGKAWMHASGGKTESELVFDSKSSQWILIDHSRQRFSVFNENSLQKLASEMALAAPLLKGFGAQLQKLNPQQKKRWEGLLQGVPFEEIENQKKRLESMTFRKDPSPRIAGGISCSSLEIKTGSDAFTLCLAPHLSFNVAPEDARTLEAMEQSLDRLKAGATALLNTISTHTLQTEIPDIRGIPVFFKERSGGSVREVEFSRVEALAPESFPTEIPKGYQQEKFPPW